MQQVFATLVDDAVERCRAYFGGRLTAFYLHGSVAQGDAIPGVSDLDTYLVIEDEMRLPDRQWLAEAEKTLVSQYLALTDGVHLTACSIAELQQNDFAKFALKYNAILITGRDVVSEMQVPLPDAQMARGRLSFARQCFRDALAGRQPANTGDIPADTYDAARKFARYFVIIEGAYFLMAQGVFVSFEKQVVLAGLRAYGSVFQNVLDATECVLADAHTAQLTQTDYLRMIEPFVKWMFDEIAIDG